MYVEHQMTRRLPMLHARDSQHPADVAEKEVV